MVFNTQKWYTYHFTIDFVEMYFTNFVYNVFRMKRHEPETCKKKKLTSFNTIKNTSIMLSLL